MDFGTSAYLMIPDALLSVCLCAYAP